MNEEAIEEVIPWLTEYHNNCKLILYHVIDFSVHKRVIALNPNKGKHGAYLS